MGKTVEYADGSPLKMKKKSKENKNMTNNPMLVGDVNSHLETEDGDLKKKKKDKHREKKRKSEPKEDGETDGDHLKKEKRDKHRKKRQSEPKEDEETDGVHLKKEKRDKHRKKRKSEPKEDGDEDQHDKGNLKNDDIDTEMNRTMTEESALKTRDMEDKSMEKRKDKVKAKVKCKSKKVSFSGQVEVSPASETQPEKQTTTGDGLVRGKRFTPEEDEIVKQAVLDFITANGLGEEGLKMVLNCKSYKGMIKCWQDIGLCLPYRPHTAVYCRAHILFERCEARSWTPEEKEMLKEFHEQHGNNWKKLADQIGKRRSHIRDTWRRIKLENKKSGKWSQEEYQNLYDLVNLDLQMKISSEETTRKSKHGMLRDNIPWSAISEKLTTRTDATCCVKWYNQLTSSLVAENKWCDADDYRMIGPLYEMDAACVDDVDWDNVLEHRPGDVCLKRWNQMVKHIGDYRSKSFGEQVEILAERYSPNLAETREVWDNKPIVP